MRNLKEEGQEKEGKGVKIFGGGVEGKERGNKGEIENEMWVSGYRKQYFVK